MASSCARRYAQSVGPKPAERDAEDECCGPSMPGCPPTPARVGRASLCVECKASYMSGQRKHVRPCAECKAFYFGKYEHDTKKRYKREGGCGEERDSIRDGSWKVLMFVHACASECTREGDSRNDLRTEHTKRARAETLCSGQCTAVRKIPRSCLVYITCGRVAALHLRRGVYMRV